MGWTVGASGFDCQQMHEIVFKMSAQILVVEPACYFIVRSAGVRQLEHEAERLSPCRVKSVELYQQTETFLSLPLLKVVGLNAFSKLQPTVSFCHSPNF